MEKLFGKKVNDEVLAEVIRSYDAKYGIKMRRVNNENL